MKKVLIDASSAIILFKSGLFDKLTQTYYIVMAKAVCGELTQEGYPGAEVFREYCSDKDRVLQLPNHGEADISQLGRGEKNTIRHYIRGNGEFIVIDDGKGAAYCRDNRIPYINALLFPRILYVSGDMAETDYHHKTEMILRVGRYSQKIIDYAARCSKDKLEFFLP
ncbi:hypothetical protein [Desulfonema magnum]|uniref:Uncharacterized protein n=1 Tax=Desulfonema magnum TaxID=45655 RepID=A0A975GUC1_9BACT|nr:hypothetical protein [Desulfonema magnum]QTA93926.1 Uncharacterized protein dnm_100340 [Desulfonema magnum]